MTTEVVKPADDPQIGNLATPINSSPFTKALINNLPAYRAGLSPQRRGLEIGMAHGYLLYGPFTYAGPLRNSDVSDLAGLIGAAGLVVILTICLSIYGSSQPNKPISTVTNPNPPSSLETSEGWSEFAGSFLIGGIGGAAFAYLLFQVFNSGVFHAIGNLG
ncbi:photosystem I reaction center subunit XI [Thermocoleostomius sinensis]|jgi:photosystem I subunit 11|uniref:Photosystem I reaction center subunit XI n=1 Tax=Thermocoleostomius sinensis A174 TaxID=2016057 RepID=A0A9E9C6U8_9CYAN|nr:photosystem I reaction center subunit XI [Thermocoleostomius sinensis]WAL62656.1 photosystem I reaction center subunit XI [Thermocoleostomius sinensis A174]